MFENLKVTAYPRCAIVTDSFLPLDGILLFAAMRQEYGPQLLTTPGVADIPIVALPLMEKRSDNDKWYYACSFAQWGAFADGSSHWNKRFDLQHEGLIDFGKRRGKVIIEQGQYKAYHMPVFYRHALAVSWYCVGEQSAVQDLLRSVTHIGKKTSQGWGRIIDWKIEKVDYDWSVWDDGGSLMRSIPDETGILYGCRPPYWLPQNQANCRLPDH